MSSPVLVAAQCAVQAGDLVANLALHLDFMRRAGELDARLIIFPELSLSGYEPALAGALAQPADSPLLEPLCSLAMTAGMTAVVGLPLRVPGRDKPQIAACILHPDGSRAIYTKQYLHAGTAWCRWPANRPDAECRPRFAACRALEHATANRPLPSSPPS